MPDTTTARLRIMLQGYEQQLLAARRLARFRVRRRLAAGEDPREPDPLPKRHATVEQVARELYDMLLYTGSDNPVVEDIRQELSQELGRDGTGALTPEQQRAARHALWRITRRRVDKGVLRPAPGFCPGHSGAE